MANNQTKLLFLLRKNRGSRILEDLKEKISGQTCIKELRLTSLDQRDVLWEKFCFLLQNETSRYVFKLKNQENNFQARKLLTQLRKFMTQSSCHIFLSHFEDIGAIQIDAPVFFENALNLLEIDGDSVFVISDDLENGMLLDYYESDIGIGWTYEIIVLGQKWVDTSMRAINNEYEAKI